MGEISISKSRCVNLKIYWTLERDRVLFLVFIFINIIVNDVREIVKTSDFLKDTV